MSVTLLQWRRRVFELYAEVRRCAEEDPEGTLARFRAGRDELFANHPDSPLSTAARPGFTGLPYAPYDPALRFEAAVEPIDPLRMDVERSDGQTIPFVRFGRVSLPIGDLDVYWLETYGGGVFLPFRDGTSGDTTYGGGRYLLDTVKGSDLGGDGDRLVLDFNYAYHPSCFYDAEAWGCPLAPPENRLKVRIDAGELARPG